MEILRSSRRPTRGFLLHSYGGSIELVPALATLGARFSFSGYFLQEHKEKVRAGFRKVPTSSLRTGTRNTSSATTKARHSIILPTCPASSVVWHTCWGRLNPTSAFSSPTIFAGFSAWNPSE